MPDERLPYRILYVDTDARLCERYALNFKCFKQYFDFSYANDPTKVLSGILDGDFDLIITEIEFPGLRQEDAQNYLAQLKQRAFASKIILYTQSKNTGLIDNCIRTNTVDGYYRKSVTGTDLVAESFKLLMGGVPKGLG